VVDAAELAAALDGEHVEGVLDDADRGGITAGVRADAAELALGDEVAATARPYRAAQLGEGRGEPLHRLPGRDQAVEGEPLGGLGTDPGQASELRGQPLDRRGNEVHRPG